VIPRLNAPTSRTYGAVDAALPAGRKPVNEALAISAPGVLDEAETGSDRWLGSFNDTETHDDRLLREAEMMDRPETRGRTATGTLVVERPAARSAAR